MSYTNTYRYPNDLQINDNTDYIKFCFYEYQPPFKRGGEGAAGYYQSEKREGNIGKKYKQDIILYMPQDVSTSMSTSWGGKEISNAAAGFLSTYANATSAEGAVVDNIAAGASNMLKAIPATVGAGLVNLGLNATGAQSNLGMNDILGGTAGIILNPNTELLFGGPAIRNIGFKFKMAARSQKEAQTMIAICRQFQFHASSKLGASNPLLETTSKGLQSLGNLVFSEPGGKTQKPFNFSNEQIKDFAVSNNFVTVPDLCLFKYMTGGDHNKYINQYKACAITNVDVNFTPDGSYSTLIGGYPSALELSLKFVETKIIYQSEIQTVKGVSN